MESTLPLAQRRHSALMLPDECARVSKDALQTAAKNCAAASRELTRVLPASLQTPLCGLLSTTKRLIQIYAIVLYKAASELLYIGEKRTSASRHGSLHDAAVFAVQTRRQLRQPVAAQFQVGRLWQQSQCRK